MPTTEKPHLCLKANLTIIYYKICNNYCFILQMKKQAPEWASK